MVEESVRKKRIKSIVNLYYSRRDVQEAIFKFCKNRETAPSYMMESFGKRPDSFQYRGDIYELVRRGATSFHCSEELWEDPLKITSNMTEEEYNELRIGWDLLIDIDCKWFDYAKKAAKVIIETFKRTGIKNIGIKFSGSKGFHILIPWKAFPKEINGKKTSDLFPELARQIIGYVKDYSERIFNENLPENFEEEFKNVKIKRGYKCKTCNEVATTYTQVELYCDFCKIGETRKVLSGDAKKEYRCPECNHILKEKKLREVYECPKCHKNSLKNPENFSQSKEVDLFDLMGLDLILVSPRHLFRAPYSLHEKTALASVVLSEKELEKFELKDADPMKIKIKNFMPNAEEGEAKKLVMQTLDWVKNKEIKGTEESKKITGKYAEFKPIKLKNLTDEEYPPSIKKILNGLSDGKKRALFVLINFFRSIGLEKEELEKKLKTWNEKNNPPLKEGYIRGQLMWSYKRKPIMPPNFSSDYYKGIGIEISPEETHSKNPVNYTIRKNLSNKKASRK